MGNQPPGLYPNNYKLTGINNKIIQQYENQGEENLNDWNQDEVKTREYNRLFEIWDDDYKLNRDRIMIKTLQIE